MLSFDALVSGCEILVCCGAGGVGKTTVSAGLALAAAQRGQRVLIMTIDPAKRLAQLLEVDSHPPEPVVVTIESDSKRAPVTLETWMLDPLVVAEKAVAHAIKDKTDVQRFLDNPVYRQLSQMTTGMQEYSAMKALHGFHQSGDYDLIIVDTPPSRHALDFLDAPKRLETLFTSRFTKLFRLGDSSFLRRAANKILTRTMTRLLGKDFAESFMFFMSQFEVVFDSFKADATEMCRLLSTEKCSFLLVTSPRPQAVKEAFTFHDRARSLGLPVGGFVFNKSQGHLLERRFPTAADLPDALAATMLQELQDLAAHEQVRGNADRKILQQVRERAGSALLVLELPLFDKAHDSLDGLAHIAQTILSSHSELYAESKTQAQ